MAERKLTVCPQCGAHGTRIQGPSSAACGRCGGTGYIEIKNSDIMRTPCPNCGKLLMITTDQPHNVDSSSVTVCPSCKRSFSISQPEVKAKIKRRSKRQFSPKVVFAITVISILVLAAFFLWKYLS